MRKKKATKVELSVEEKRAIKKAYMAKYPFQEPCVNCIWWKALSGGYPPREAKNPYAFAQPTAACHYHLITNTTREHDDFVMFYVEHKCDYFVKMKKGAKK